MDFGEFFSLKFITIHIGIYTFWQFCQKIKLYLKLSAHNFLIFVLGTVGASGKASHGVAKFVPGAALQAAQAGASGVSAELARTRMALDERGEKLGRLEDK